jgi:hypothetical protein
MIVPYTRTITPGALVVGTVTVPVGYNGIYLANLEAITQPTHIGWVSLTGVNPTVNGDNCIPVTGSIIIIPSGGLAVTVKVISTAGLPGGFVIGGMVQL